MFNNNGEKIIWLYKYLLKYGAKATCRRKHKIYKINVTGQAQTLWREPYEQDVVFDAG